MLKSILAALLLMTPVAYADSPADPSQPAVSNSNTGNKGGLMNPDVSIDGLFALSQFDRPDPLVVSGGHDPKINGFNMQQVELSLSSVVDPYFRFDSNIVMITEAGETRIEVEEAYGTTLALPANLQLRAGQFFTRFGRQNATHPHAWWFANKPLVAGRMFGGDGLRNPGAMLSWLTPLPWYAELSGSVQNSTGSTAVSFLQNNPVNTQRTPLRYLTMLRLVNFFELSDPMSLQVGGSYLTGPNDTSTPDQVNRTRITGVDVYLRYRPVSGKSFIALQSEVMQRHYQTPDGALNDWGYYAELGYLLPGEWERWMVGARYDWVSAKANPVRSYGQVSAPGEDRDTSSRHRISPFVAFYPSEFSKLRLQYDNDKPASFAHAQQAVTLQFEFGIGAHAAHAF